MAANFTCWHLQVSIKVYSSEDKTPRQRLSDDCILPLVPLYKRSLPYLWKDTCIMLRAIIFHGGHLTFFTLLGKLTGTQKRSLIISGTFLCWVRHLCNVKFRLCSIWMSQSKSLQKEWRIMICLIGEPITFVNIPFINPIWASNSYSNINAIFVAGIPCFIIIYFFS